MTNDFKVKYTNKDIIEKIESVNLKLERLVEHVSAQNGRVSRIEKFKTGCMYAFGTGFIALVGWLIMVSLRL